MSVKEKLMHVVYEPNDFAAYKSLTQEIARYSESGCASLASGIKELFEDKNESPVRKLAAMKVTSTQLLNQCMKPDNPNLLLAVQRRLLDRLGILARHKKPSQDPQRGEDLFGYVSLQTSENAQASAEFLKVLLLCLRKWATHYHLSPDGKESGFSTLYAVLTKEGVAFDGFDQPPTPKNRPSRDLSGRPSKRFFSDIDRVTACARSLSQELDAGASPSVTGRLAGELQGYQAQLFDEVNARTSSPGSEVEMQMLLEATEAASIVLQRYAHEERKQPADARPAPDRDDFRRGITDDIDERILKLKAEVTDVRNQLFAKRTAAQGNKTPEMLRKEAENKLQALVETHEHALAEVVQQDREGDMQLPGLQQKVYELQAIIDNTKARNAELTIELDKAHKQLETIRFENVTLRDKASPKAKVASPVLSPGIRASDTSFFSAPSSELLPQPQIELDVKGYATQRNSEEPVVAVQESSPVRNLSRLPVCNEPDFRKMCFQDQGRLFENEIVLVGYQGKIADLEGQFRILIANKSAYRLTDLSLLINEEPVEGVRIATEGVRPMELNPQGKIYRVYRVSVFRPFQVAPALLISFIHASALHELCLRLPLIYPLFLRPAVLSHDRVLPNWDGLREWEAIGHFPALHPDITSMAFVAAIVRFNSNFSVLTETEIPELGRGRVLALGEIKEYMAWALVTIERVGDLRPSGKVAVRCRNQESRLCLLNTLIDFLAADSSGG